MPLYEYKCDKCEHVFSDMYKMDERNVPTQNPCPNCKGEQCVQQQIGAPALVSPFSISGLKKPQIDFKERMRQIKQGMGKTTAAKHIKDY